MKQFAKILKQMFCRHRFDLDDLISRETTDDGLVHWPCWKCGKMFRAEYGLAIFSNGQAGKKPKE